MIGARDTAESECLLCRLIMRQTEVSMVHEDPCTVAFMDIRPVQPGHMLVVPRIHAPFLADLDPDHGAQLFLVAQLAAEALRRSTLRCEGVNLFLADGEAAGQEIFHVHLHVFPRFAGDGFGLRFPPDYAVRPRIELDATANVLRDAWPVT
jgi:histidine triad (HIT) family protein